MSWVLYEGNTYLYSASGVGFFIRETMLSAAGLEVAGVGAIALVESISDSNHCRYPPGSICTKSGQQRRMNLGLCLCLSIGETDIYVLNKAMRLTIKGATFPVFMSVRKKRICTTSNWPRSSSGKGVKASCMWKCKFAGIDTSGGYCACEISNPSRDTESGSSQDISIGHILFQR